MQNKSPLAPGQASFEAYNSHGPRAGLTHDGKPVPAWPDLSDDVRAKWAAAEKAAGKARLEQFPPIAHVDVDSSQAAFRRALVRYEAECIMQSAPFPTRILLECFEDELSKLPSR
jgi:hypothetical protein